MTGHCVSKHVLTIACVAAVMVCSVARAAEAQRARVEISSDAGFAAAEGEPPPNLATIGVGVSIRFAKRWWGSWSGSFGPGSRPDQYLGRTQPPFPQFDGDRRYLRSGHLSLQRVTVSYHSPSAHRLSLVVGGGLLLSAGFDRSFLLADTIDDIREMTTREPWSGLSYHVLVRYQLSKRLSLDPGLVVDTSFDRTYYQPVVRVTFGF
jgi:hypothetical protein